MMYSNAKRIYFTLVVSAAVSGFLIVCTLGRTVYENRVETRLTAASISEKAPEYVVRENGSRAAVFRNGDDKPYLLIDIDLALMSEFDRKEISKGIYLENERELKRFIEDISS
ncbi:hypothetical protein [Ruminococcus sp.]|uniref:hypothetical protein n=1 Tax=Ruminococcus sp. TaxID=41978 RepID=UPI0025F79607|nr:hypothetical protein [Ruminococcus sp.]